MAWKETRDGGYDDSDGTRRRSLRQSVLVAVDGWGNGLDDDAWAAIVDVTSEDAARVILRRLQHAGVPAYTSGVTRFGTPSHRPKADRHRYRIWVGSGSYGRAETMLLQIVPELSRLLGANVLAR